MRPLFVMHITNMLPDPCRPSFGIFVRRQIDSLRCLGTEADLLFVDGKKTRTAYLTGWRAIRRALGVRPPDIVHAHHSYVGFLYAATNTRRIPLVVSVCGEDELGGAGSRGGALDLLRRLAVRMALRRASRVIVKSHHLELLLPDYSRPKSVVLPNGVNTNLFKPMAAQHARAFLGIAGEQPVLLFPGNPDDPNKGFDLVSDAVDVLREKGTTVRVLALTGVNAEKVPYYMNAADAVVFASHREGSPNVIKEALACGRPVVSVEVGDVGHQLAELPGCRIVKRDPTAFADAIADVMNDPDVDARLRRAEPLDETVIARRLIGIYETCLQRA